MNEKMKIRFAYCKVESRGYEIRMIIIDIINLKMN